ncbi:MAG: DUF3293 domain-containing protein [Planctomycetes bacterium]|nr:DUF3293 domain-containing protein [Planctomycetota bacterium]MDA0948127.1 DUF3293 domain-containing protein [Planctomycetota bacterium]
MSGSGARTAPDDERPGTDSAERGALQQAYRNTAYEALGPGTQLDLRVDEPHAALDALLDATGRRSWAFMTACNPRSRTLPAEENEERQWALWTLLEELGGEDGSPPLLLPGRGRGLTGAWPAEESVLALGIARLDALRLMRRFDQHAFLAGTRGGRAELVWCDDA